MASSKIRVKVAEITPKYNVTDTLEKSEIIGLIEGEYPEEFLFEFLGDKADMVDEVAEGTYVTVHFNIKCRRAPAKNEGERDRFFTSLNAWKIEA